MQNGRQEGGGGGGVGCRGGWWVGYDAAVTGGAPEPRVEGWWRAGKGAAPGSAFLGMAALDRLWDGVQHSSLFHLATLTPKDGGLRPREDRNQWYAPRVLPHSHCAASRGAAGAMARQGPPAHQSTLHRGSKHNLPLYPLPLPPNTRRLRPHRPPGVPRGMGQPALRGGVVRGRLPGRCCAHLLHSPPPRRFTRERLSLASSASPPNRSINDPFMDVKYAVYQLSYDSVHGRFKGTVEAGESECGGGGGWGWWGRNARFGAAAAHQCSCAHGGRAHPHHTHRHHASPRDNPHRPPTPHSHHHQTS